MIKAIIFDIGGVLITNPVPKMVQHYRGHFGAEEIQFTEAIETFINEFQKGIITEKELWKNLNDVLGMNIDVEEDLWLKGYIKAYEERESMFAHIKQLRADGYQVGIMSNTEHSVMNYFRHKHKGKFDVEVYSCEVNMSKPNADIFEFTLKKFEVNPHEALFIDDKSENVEGAKMAGLQTLLFETEKQYLRDVAIELSQK
jgi:epoxide hydrolase-like predicted phosphatase